LLGKLLTEKEQPDECLCLLAEGPGIEQRGKENEERCVLEEGEVQSKSLLFQPPFLDRHSVTLLPAAFHRLVFFRFAIGFAVEGKTSNFAEIDDIVVEYLFAKGADTVRDTYLWFTYTVHHGSSKVKPAWT
jgi:hypothetical protein